MRINEYDILMAEHAVLRESGEFAFASDDQNYANYVEGVLDLTDKLLERASTDIIDGLLNKRQEQAVDDSDDYHIIYTDEPVGPDQSPSDDGKGCPHAYA